MFRFWRDTACLLEREERKGNRSGGYAMIGKGINKKNRLRLVQPVLQVFFI